MTRKYWDTKDFKKLQAKWYAKLKDLHFSDIEYYSKNADSGFSTLNSQVLPYNIKHLSHLEFKNTLEYFNHAAHFANLHKFPSRLHKFVWELYVEGISYRKMQPLIKARGFKHIPSIFWISTKLQELRVQFKKYTNTLEDPEQGLHDFIASNRS